MSNQFIDLASYNVALGHAQASFDFHKSKIVKPDLMVVIDFKVPSYKKRFFIVKNGALLDALYVSHGVKSSDPSDLSMAKYFSNVIGSRKSSLGAMLTGEVYHGKHGRSLRLDGLDKCNSMVRARSIVIHAADYVGDSYVRRNGRCGQSWGCPAIDPALSDMIIDLIKGGTFIYIDG